MLQFSPILTGNNELFVHHILVYECDNLNDTYVGHSAPCYLRGGVIDNAVQQCTRGTIIAGWTIGALVSLVITKFDLMFRISQCYYKISVYRTLFSQLM